MKTCKKCKSIKDLGYFYKDCGLKDGHANICKDCKNLETSRWRKKNKRRYNASVRDYNSRNYQRLRLVRYKLTLEEHTKMLADQKGVCAICKKPPQGKRPLCVDHCHSTGTVRGLLCYGCNRALHVLETQELLDQAKLYLSKLSQ